MYFSTVNTTPWRLLTRAQYLRYWQETADLLLEAQAGNKQEVVYVSKHLYFKLVYLDHHVSINFALYSMDTVIWLCAWLLLGAFASLFSWKLARVQFACQRACLLLVLLLFMVPAVLVTLFVIRTTYFACWLFQGSAQSPESCLSIGCRTHWPGTAPLLALSRIMPDSPEFHCILGGLFPCSTPPLNT